MRFNEQRWLDFAPSLCRTHVLRDRGVNVAYFNLHERPLSVVDGRIHAGDAPLRAFHFSGYELSNPDVLCRYPGPRPRINLNNEPIVRQLCDNYRQAVLAEGEDAVSETPLFFDELPGGIEIDPTLREVFRAAVVGGEKQGLGYPPDPYDLAQRPLFLKWTELTYASANLPLPSWVGTSRRAPSKAPVPQPAASISPDDTGDLVRRLAASTAAAVSNLDNRIAIIERELAELTSGAPLQRRHGVA
jgi:hypothetical protein